MGIFGGSSPSAPPPPPPPPNPATLADSTVAQAGAQQRALQANASGAGFADTITNAGGSAGVSADTLKKTLGGS